MKKLCFGTYATVLVKCRASSTTQKQLIGTMLLAVNSNYDIRTDDATVSALVLGHTNLSGNIICYMEEHTPTEITAYFKEKVLPLLNLNKKETIVLALRSIIAEDTNITDDREIEMVNKLTKADILSRDSFVFEDFLAGLFIYIVKYTANNKKEKNVKEITDAFINSFDKRQNEITFIKSYSLKNDAVLSTITANAQLVTLMGECGGSCPRCGKLLSSDNSIAFPLNTTESILLCLDCAGKVQESEEERAKMLEHKKTMQEHYRTRDAIATNQLFGEIKELLSIISNGEPLSASALTMVPLKAEQKITDSLLLRKIRSNVVDGMYEMVNDAIEQLAAENKLNVKKFRKSIKRMYEDAEDSTKSQSEIFNSLVLYLYARAGMKYHEACEILISYFVQSCEVFHETAR